MFTTTTAPLENSLCFVVPQFLQLQLNPNFSITVYRNTNIQKMMFTMIVHYNEQRIKTNGFSKWYIFKRRFFIILLSLIRKYLATRVTAYAFTQVLFLHDDESDGINKRRTVYCITRSFFAITRFTKSSEPAAASAGL